MDQAYFPEQIVGYNTRESLSVAGAGGFERLQRKSDDKLHFLLSADWWLMLLVID